MQSLMSRHALVFWDDPGLGRVGSGRVGVGSGRLSPHASRLIEQLS